MKFGVNKEYKMEDEKDVIFGKSIHEILGKWLWTGFLAIWLLGLIANVLLNGFTLTWETFFGFCGAIVATLFVLFRFWIFGDN